MADIVAAVPGFWLLAAATLVATLAEIAVLLVSRARLARQASAAGLAGGGDWQAVAALKPPSRALEIVAALLPLMLAAAFVRTIQGARHLLIGSLSGSDPSEKALLANQSISAEFNATPLGILAVGLTAALGCVAVGLAISARRRAGGLRRAAALAPAAPEAAAAWLKIPGPNPPAIVVSIAVFLVLGLGPIARAAYAAMVGKIHAFAVAGGSDAPGAEKGAMLDRALDEASRLLDGSVPFSRAGIGLAVLVAAVLAWTTSSARARARLLAGQPPSEARGSLFGPLTACGAIAVAVAAYVAARPLRRENQLPWPPYDAGEQLLALTATPDLEGPDVLERAPVIEITPNRTALDGREWDLETLEGMLGTLSHNYGLLQPDTPFNGLALIVCQPDTPVDRVSAALRAAVRGGFSHPMFVFLRRQVAERPLLGRHWRNACRAARTTAVETKAGAESGATIVDVAGFPTCAALSQEIVVARRAGHDVALLLPPDRSR